MQYKTQTRAQESFVYRKLETATNLCSEVLQNLAPALESLPQSL